MEKRSRGVVWAHSLHSTTSFPFASTLGLPPNNLVGGLWTPLADVRAQPHTPENSHLGLEMLTSTIHSHLGRTASTALHRPWMWTWGLYEQGILGYLEHRVHELQVGRSPQTPQNSYRSDTLQSAIPKSRKGACRLIPRATPCSSTPHTHQQRGMPLGSWQVLSHLSVWTRCMWRLLPRKSEIFCSPLFIYSNTPIP